MKEAFWIGFSLGFFIGMGVASFILEVAARLDAIPK